MPAFTRHTPWFFDKWRLRWRVLVLHTKADGCVYQIGVQLLMLQVCSGFFLPQHLKECHGWLPRLAD